MTDWGIAMIHRTNPLVVYADGPDSARTNPATVLRLAGIRGTPDVLLGWTVERHPWLGDPALRTLTVLAGYALARLVNEGSIEALPVRLSAVPTIVRAASPDVVVVSGIRRGDALAFGSSVGWGDAAARVAPAVVVEVDEQAPDLGAPEITCLLYTSPSPRDRTRSRMPSSA